MIKHCCFEHIIRIQRCVHTSLIYLAKSLSCHVDDKSLQNFALKSMIDLFSVIDFIFDIIYEE